MPHYTDRCIRTNYSFLLQRALALVSSEKATSAQKDWEKINTCAVLIGFDISRLNVLRGIQFEEGFAVNLSVLS